jgi:FemAB-related protein (PEP-CTERM system-associated)
MDIKLPAAEARGDDVCGTPRTNYLKACDYARWNDFIDACPEASFFHRAEWKTVIERAFGHSTYYLYAETGGRLTGVLPLVHVKSLLFGNALISTPFCVYGGAVAADKKAARELEDDACRLAQKLGVDYLELRNRTPRCAKWQTKNLYVTFRKPIHAGEEQNLKGIPRKQRAVVRKSIAAGLRAVEDDGVDRLYDVYAQSVHNLGTPVFSRRYFQLLKQTFGPACRVLTVLDGSRAVSSVMSFYFRKEVLPYYGGGTAAARHLKANDFMYWELMCRAAERGARVFDFGRSKRDSGSYRFKTHWGFEPEPLHYQYHLVKAKAVPNISPANPKYRLFIKGWQCLPHPLTRTLGPMLAKNLG